MSDGNWTNMIAAERMRVDQQFEEQLTASTLSRQQWGLVMTAVEFEIDDPDDPEVATLRADTSKLPSVMSEIEQLGERGGGMGAGMGGAPSSGDSGGGLLSKLTSALSLGGGDSGGGALQAEAEELAAEYATKLQDHLEKRGRWATICAKADDD